MLAIFDAYSVFIIPALFALILCTVWEAFQ